MNRRVQSAIICVVTIPALAGCSMEAEPEVGIAQVAPPETQSDMPPDTPSAPLSAAPLAVLEVARPALSSVKLTDSGQIPTVAETRLAVAIIVDSAFSDQDRGVAVRVFGRAGDDAREHVSELARAMLSEDWSTQDHACQAIRAMGLPSPQAVPDLARVLLRTEPPSHGWDACRRDIAELLGYLGRVAGVKRFDCPQPSHSCR